MRAVFCSFLLLTCCVQAETYRLTLGQAVSRALSQNPQVVLARLDEQRALQAVEQAKDPFSTKLYVGSGLAYTSGIPLNAPSVVQFNVLRSFVNRPQTFAIAEARERARGVAIATDMKKEDIAYEAASVYLDAAGVQRSMRALRDQIPSLERSIAVVNARVSEGRELPLQQSVAKLALARVQQRIAAFQAQGRILGRQLAVLCGFTAEDEVEVEEVSAQMPQIAMAEDRALDDALRSSKEVRRLESDLLARGLAQKGAKQAWLPQVDLVAQYAILAEFNNYRDFYNRFERNNYQFGVSFKLPLLPGSGPRAAAAVADIDQQKLRMQMSQTRSRITLNVRRGLEELKIAEDARNLARLELDVAREQISVLLAQYEEGRLPLTQLEEARTIENERWLQFFQAQIQADKWKLQILRETGQLDRLVP